MKFSIAWAAAAAGILQFSFIASLLAQGAGGAAAGGATNRPITPVRPSGTNVAVIDISLVFEHFPGFQKKMEELKAQVEEFEGQMKAEGKKMMDMKDKMEGYTRGSEPYKQAEEAMARKNSEMQIQVAKQRREFLEAEARIYFEAYNEVYREVSTLAERNDIRLVLRFSSEQMKPDDRNSVLTGVNRPVVYQRSLNITNMVITALGGTPPPAGGKGSSAGEVSRREPLAPGPKPKTRTE